MLGVAECSRVRSNIQSGKRSKSDGWTPSLVKAGEREGALTKLLLNTNPEHAFSLTRHVNSGARPERSGRRVMSGELPFHSSNALSRRFPGLPLAGALALASAFPAASNADDGPQWSEAQFLEALKNDDIQAVVFSGDSRSMLTLDNKRQRHFTAILPEQAVDFVSKLQEKGTDFTVETKKDGDDFGAMVGKGIINLLPIILVGGLIYYQAQQMGPQAGAGAQDMGKVSSKIQMDPQTGVTFEDVAGADGAKLELMEVVDFLKDPTKYSALGAKIPKGAIMEGPPGTGKTLLARAVAGEAGVPFVSASASEFVEQFAGVGASRVRDLFGQAKKNAPCIIFIDELDAIGRSRSAGGSGGNDEREQTLNQMLTEMDGFEGNTGVIVLAATNRADVLDAALVRPGRFDRRVPVDLPDVKGRLAILKVHCRGKPLAKEIDLNIVAKRTTGFSGASLANLMNEAAIVAARNGKPDISYNEIDYAIDRQTVGMQKTTGMTFPARQKLVAYHEAGHALMGLLEPDYDMVTKVTIIPRTSGAGGFTLFTPSEERLESGMYTKKYLCSQLAVALGGRCAEEIIYGKTEITTGASNDLQQVRNIARRMVAQWGFGENLGEAPVAWEQPDGNNLMAPKMSSQKTQMQIDEEVSKLVKVAYDKTMKTLTDNKEFLDAMTDRLIAEETIDYKQLEEMREQYGAKTIA